MCVITCPKCGGVAGFYVDSNVCTSCRIEERESAVTIPKARLEALEEVAETIKRVHAEDLEREPVEGCFCTLCSIRSVFKKLDALAKEEKQS